MHLKRLALFALASVTLMTSTGCVFFLYGHRHHHRHHRHHHHRKVVIVHEPAPDCGRVYVERRWDDCDD